MCLIGYKNKDFVLMNLRKYIVRIRDLVDFLGFLPLDKLRIRIIYTYIYIYMYEIMWRDIIDIRDLIDF